MSKKESKTKSAEQSDTNSCRGGCGDRGGYRGRTGDVNCIDWNGANVVKSNGANAMDSNRSKLSSGKNSVHTSHSLLMLSYHLMFSSPYISHIVVTS